METLGDDVCEVQTPNKENAAGAAHDLLSRTGVATPQKQRMPEGSSEILQESRICNVDPADKDGSAAVPPVAADGIPEQNSDESISQTVSLVFDQIEWLDEMVAKYSLPSRSHVIQCLMRKANAEAPKTKRLIFLVIRCRRCLQHQKGGTKEDCVMELTSRQWQWLEMIRNRSRHLTVDKTLRIILDFYMPLLKEDEAFERLLLASTAA